MIPYSTHTITDEDKKAVVAALESRWIAGSGPLTEAFEDALCDFSGYEHAIAVSNGTCALHLAYMCARDLWGFDRIVTTPLTFVATASAAIHADLDVVLGDIDEHTYVLNSRPSMYNVPVSYAGYPSPFHSIISDDCHYIVRGMAEYQSTKISIGSGHAVKPLTCGEGAWLLTDDWEVASYARQLRDHGRIGGKATIPGFNYRVSDILCALGLSQLKRLDESLERRKQIAQAYYNHWRNDPRIVLPQDHPRHGWHLYVIRVKNRDRFRQLLLDDGIGTQWHYVPIYQLPIMDNTHRMTLDPNVSVVRFNEIASQIVSIPLFAGMSDDDVNDVIMAIDKALEVMDGDS